MNIEEIKISGLLELYVLGQLSEAETRKVYDWMEAFPEIRKEVRELEQTMEVYAQSTAITAPPSVLNNVLAEIDSSSNEPPSSKSSFTKSAPQKITNANGGIPGWLKGLLFLSLLGLAAALFAMFKNGNEVTTLENRYQTLIDSCDAQSTTSNQQIDFLNQHIEQLVQLANPKNKTIQIQATEKYPQTDIILYTNSEDNRNFIKINSLPTLAASQSFQLWSLKGTDAPNPMDVFEQLPVDAILEVGHVDAPDAYAITIEPKGGSQSPNLEELIGVMALASAD